MEGWMPEIGFADALQRVFPTTVSSDLPFRGWICQETLCDGSLVTFDLRQCGVPYVPAAQEFGSYTSVAERSGARQGERAGQQLAKRREIDRLDHEGAGPML